MHYPGWDHARPPFQRLDAQQRPLKTYGKHLTKRKRGTKQCGLVSFWPLAKIFCIAPSCACVCPAACGCAHRHLQRQLERHKCRCTWLCMFGCMCQVWCEVMLEMHDLHRYLSWDHPEIILRSCQQMQTPTWSQGRHAMPEWAPACASVFRCIFRVFFFFWDKKVTIFLFY